MKRLKLTDFEPLQKENKSLEAELTTANERLEEQKRKDYTFLMEMHQRLDNAHNDVTEMDMVKTMINDWMDELVKLLKGE